MLAEGVVPRRSTEWHQVGGDSGIVLAGRELSCGVERLQAYGICGSESAGAVGASGPAGGGSGSALARAAAASGWSSGGGGSESAGVDAASGWKPGREKKSANAHEGRAAGCRKKRSAECGCVVSEGATGHVSERWAIVSGISQQACVRLFVNMKVGPVRVKCLWSAVSTCSGEDGSDGGPGWQWCHRGPTGAAAVGAMGSQIERLGVAQRDESGGTGGGCND